MTAAGWRPTVDSFLGRVTKARILQAVAEAKGQHAADRIARLRKGDMAAEAETLLADTGWLPEPLRTLGRTVTDASAASEADPVSPPDSVGAESAANGYETVVVDSETSAEHEAVAEEPHTIAAE